MATWLVTGGAGFIGSNFIRMLLRDGDSPPATPATAEPLRVINLDALTYAGNLASLADIADDPRYRFIKADICDTATVATLLTDEHPHYLVNFAAESHVDRSILDATPFIHTNIAGVHSLITALRNHNTTCLAHNTHTCRFLQVSTDEVLGSITPPHLSDETYPLNPSSPYAASKAAAELFIASAQKTWGLDAVITRCSNNYGPFQFPEKLIPLMLTRAIEGKSLPLYGDGRHTRDWLHVADHCDAIRLVARKGRAGETYHVSGENLRDNLAILHAILDATGRPHTLIEHVKDRPGHDRRYALHGGKLHRELGWQPRITFNEGLRDTIAWYKSNETWWRTVQSGAYRDFYESWYERR